jgi:hypothetical protein
VVIVDASPINWIDATALQRLDELRSELAARDITLGIARGTAVAEPRIQSNLGCAAASLHGISPVPHAQGGAACLRATPGRPRRRPGASVPLVGRLEGRRAGLICSLQRQRTARTIKQSPAPSAQARSEDSALAARI